MRNQELGYELDARAHRIVAGGCGSCKKQKSGLGDQLFGTDAVGWVSGVGVAVCGEPFDSLLCDI